MEEDEDPLKLVIPHRQQDGTLIDLMAPFDLKGTCERVAEASLEKFDNLIQVYEKSIVSRDRMLHLLTKQHDMHDRLHEKYQDDIKSLHKEEQMRINCFKDMLGDCEQTMECSICFDPIAYAQTLVPCGHVFCYICIMQWIKKGTTNKCPQCNATYNRDKPLIPNNTLDKIIYQFLQNFGPTLRERFPKAFYDYEKRVKKGKETKIIIDMTDHSIPANNRALDNIFGHDIDRNSESEESVVSSDSPSLRSFASTTN